MMKKKGILFLAMIIIILLANTAHKNSVLSDQDIPASSKHYLEFIVIAWIFDSNILKLKHVVNGEAGIYFDGKLYWNGDKIEYRTGKYNISAYLSSNYKFLFWSSSSDIVIENRILPNTKAILKSSGLDLMIVEADRYSYIILVLGDARIPELYFYGNITKNSISVKNKVNNEENQRFIPNENVIIEINSVINASRPYSLNPYNSYTLMNFTNLLFSYPNLTLRYNLSLYYTFSLKWSFIKQFNGLVDINENITHQYPDSNYEIGISNRTGIGILASLSIANITWSWYEYVPGKGYQNIKITRLYIGLNFMQILIDSLYLNVKNIYIKDKEYSIKLEIFWLRDAQKVSGKAGIICVFIEELSYSIGISDDLGNIEFTINKSMLDKLLIGLNGSIHIRPQFIGGGIIQESPKSEIKWYKLATIVLGSNKSGISLKIVRLGDFQPVANATVILIVDDEITSIVNTDSKGKTNLMTPAKYNKIVIEVYANNTRDLLIANELSNIIIFDNYI
jgi:hypothetical protein